MLPRLILDGCVLEDCQLEGATCSGWRVWGCEIRDASFARADLRGAAIGPVVRGRRNSYCRVKFTESDLRDTVHLSSDMGGCDFSNARLTGVLFKATVFEDCTFAGEVREVQFYREPDFFEGLFPPNRMKGVDFSRATLGPIALKGLDLSELLALKWPEDEHQLLMVNPSRSLESSLRRPRGELQSERSRPEKGIEEISKLDPARPTAGSD